MNPRKKSDKEFKDMLRLVASIYDKCHYSRPYARVRNNKLEYVRGSYKCRLKT